MRKKDYELIASVLKQKRHELFMLDDCRGDYATGFEWAIEPVIKALADAFEQQNKQFNRSKFLRACGLEAN